MRLGAVRLERLAPSSEQCDELQEDRDNRVAIEGALDTPPGRLSGQPCDVAVIRCSSHNQSGRPAAASVRAFGSIGVVVASVTRRVDGRHPVTIAGTSVDLAALTQISRNPPRPLESWRLAGLGTDPGPVNWAAWTD